MELITGATGYVGGRLLERLLAENRPVRALARDPARLEPRAGVEVAGGDGISGRGVRAALEGCVIAYYLVHSMGAHGGYLDKDRVAARNFGEAARRAGVRRIIYLGGLATGGEALSPHLESRRETGRLLRDSGVPVVEFQS